MRSTRQLVEAVRARDHRSERAFFDTCWPVLWRTAYTVTGNRALAEDAAQAAIVSVFATLDRFDATRPLEPWIRRIATNAALSELRRANRSRRLVHDGEPYSDAPSSDAVAASELRREVGRLDDDHRLVVVLYYWLEYSIPDIAELLGIPQGTVASRRARALEKLRARLEEEHHVQPA